MNATLDVDFEKYAVGQPVRRTEDPRLLRGGGKFTDDFNLPGQAYGYFLRSPYAHGKILDVDVSDALKAPGVLAILTAADLEEAGIGGLPCGQNLTNPDGSPMAKPFRPCLAKDKVRYGGEAVALVIAETAGQAKDAAEEIMLDVEQLDAVTDAVDAVRDGAPALFDDVANNLCVTWEFGDKDKTESIFKDAPHVTRLAIRSNRLVVNAMEPRAAVADYEADSGIHTLHVHTQGVFGFTNTMAKAIMNIPREQMRVQTYDVGGSFGMKSAPYPEYAPLLLAARKLQRPVKWCDERSDSFRSDQHARDSWADAALALDKEGRILAATVEVHCNQGAYLSPVGPNMHTGNLRKNFPAGYKIPAYSLRTHAAFTNTTPIGAYRGAGRPEGVYYMERLLDTAALELGIDRLEIRRRNYIQPSEMPYTAVSELVYDSGDFPAVMEAGVKAADWDGFDERRKASEAAGKMRGIGIATYLEVTGPPATEMGGLRFEEDGTVTMISGTLNYGQGHEAAFAQVVSTKLGIPFHKLRLLQGDSEELIAGAGTGGSRSAISGSAALVACSDEVISKGKSLAGHFLEAAVEDIAFRPGQFEVVGTDQSIGIMELAERARKELALDRPEDLPDSLDTKIKQDTPPSAFPNGCHVAEIEIEPETGVVTVVRYTVTDDFGKLINPLLVEGQVHGGVTQGIGQVLMENAVYDESGQLIAGSYMDYAMPRASDVPNFTFNAHPVPCQTNPLGVKGCGEAGTTGAMSAVTNAVVDALYRAKGIKHFDMPATPERVWQALNS